MVTATMTGAEHASWMHDFHTLEDTLSAATKDRTQRNSFDPETGELGWVLHERQVMLATVNRMRMESGMTPVSVEDIFRAESRANGHSDYVKKFALGCADIVHERA